MKIVSLWQPHASLVAEQIKIIETRSWAPPKALIGQRIGIHAAKKYIPAHHLDDSLLIPCTDAWGPGWNSDLPRGCVVATAVLVDAWQVSNDSLPAIYDDGYPMVYQARDIFDNADKCAKADPYGDFSIGRWLWFLEDIQKLDPPVPAVGHQGFWNWEPTDAMTALG